MSVLNRLQYPVVHGMHPTVRIEIGGRVFISVDTHLFIQPDELEEGSENHFIARNIRVEPKVRIENPLAGDILTPVNSHVRLRTVVVPEGRMVLQRSARRVTRIIICAVDLHRRGQRDDFREAQQVLQTFFLDLHAVAYDVHIHERGIRVRHIILLFRPAADDRLSVDRIDIACVTYGRILGDAFESPVGVLLEKSQGQGVAFVFHIPSRFVFRIPVRTQAIVRDIVDFRIGDQMVERIVLLGISVQHDHIFVDPVRVDVIERRQLVLLSEPEAEHIA